MVGSTGRSTGTWVAQGFDGAETGKSPRVTTHTRRRFLWIKSGLSPVLSVPRLFVLVVEPLLTIHSPVPEGVVVGRREPHYAVEVLVVLWEFFLEGLFFFSRTLNSVVTALQVCWRSHTQESTAGRSQRPVRRPRVSDEDPFLIPACPAVSGPEWWWLLPLGIRRGESS